MKKILVVIIALVFTGNALNATASEEQEALDSIQKQYESVKTITARFVQKSYVKTMNQTLEARGKVQIKKPGKMKWVYNAPEPQVLVSNEKILWLYIPDEGQVTKVPVESIYSSNTPALFLAGKGKLTDSFDVLAVSTDDGLITVILNPKEEDNSIDRLALVANSKSYQIVGSTVYDKLGNRTEINFSDIQVNIKISESTFKFEVPEGIELLDYSAKQ
jgi:outer membrane lipoprotein carrier protein